MRVRWTPPAFEDLEEITDYIGVDSPEAADRLFKRFDGLIGTLSRFPFSGRVVTKFNVRQWIVPGTPYKIIYRIENDELLILSILHSSRD